MPSLKKQKMDAQLLSPNQTEKEWYESVSGICATASTDPSSVGESQEQNVELIAAYVRKQLRTSFQHTEIVTKISHALNEVASLDENFRKLLKLDWH